VIISRVLKKRGRILRSSQKYRVPHIGNENKAQVQLCLIE
jgi:hypothetical protein